MSTGEPDRLEEHVLELILPTAVIESRCKICRLFRSNRRAFDLINHWLVTGEKHSYIITEARKRWGLQLSPRNLSRHFRRHVMPYVATHTAMAANLRAIHDFIARAPAPNLAASLAKSVATPLLQAVKTLNPEELLNLPRDKLLELALGAAKTLAQCLKAAADVRLATANLQLKMIRLRQQERDLLLQAFQILRRELQQHAPALLQQLQQVIEHVEVVDAEFEAAED